MNCEVKLTRMSKEYVDAIRQRDYSVSPALQIGTNTCTTVAKNQFAVGEVVLAKIKGSPLWPSTVTGFYGKHNQMVRIQWFNDYRTSGVHKGQLTKFSKCKYTSVSADIAKNPFLEAAIKEALIFLRAKSGINIPL